ncbi:hypothetical protein J6590_046645 [Homalodisca vitripennis]|nr:hypothetical protein J6590_046645 [Homalodisca vitripennis]
MCSFRFGEFGPQHTTPLERPPGCERRYLNEVPVGYDSSHRLASRLLLKSTKTLRVRQEPSLQLFESNDHILAGILAR